MESYYISPMYLGICRILYCSIICVFIGLPSYTWIGKAPNYLFDPPLLSIATLFNGFPGNSFFQALSFINLIAFFSMFLGFKSRVASLLFAITCIIGHNFWYSFGKIDHLLLWILTPVFMEMAGWANFFSIDSLTRKDLGLNVTKTDNSFWIAAFAVTVAFSMFTSGIQKLWGGWLSWDAEAVRYHLVRNYFTHQRAELLADFFVDIQSRFFWKAMDYSALVLEIGFLISIVRVKILRIFVATAVAFHVFVLLMFNIPFYSNLIAYIVFIDWTTLFGKLTQEQIINWQNRYKALLGPFVFLVLSLFAYWLIYQFFYPGSFRSPSLIETAANLFNSPNGYNFALNCFFGCAFVFLIYITVNFFRQYLIKFRAVVSQRD